MAISKPITRVEQYLAHISGMRVNVPEVPLTREEMYLAAWARKSGIEDTEMQGEPPLTLKDCIGEPFNGLVLYGKSTQVTTTGAQLLKLVDREPVTICGLTWQIKNQCISVNGTATDEGNVTDFYICGARDAYADVDFPEGEITISADLPKDIAMYVVKNRGTTLTYIASNKKDGSFEHISGSKYRILFRVTKKGAICDNVIKVMFNTGNTALPWEPYTSGKPSPSPDYPQEIVSAGEDGSVTVKVTGRNILDMRNSKESVANSGVTYTRNADYSFTRTGTATEAMGNVWMAGGYLVKPKADLSNVFCVLLKGVKYSIKDCALLTVSPAGNVLAARNENFVPTQDMYITGVRNENFIVGETYNDIVYPAVYVGEKALQYEPYREQFLTIPTPNGLPGIPVTSGGNYTDENGQQWVCDELDFERGVYRRRIKHANVVFYKTASSSTHGGYRHMAVDIKNLSREYTECLCNIATYSRDAANGKEGIRASGGYNALVLYYDNLTNDTVPANVAYILSDPIETPLSETDIAAYRALTTYKGTTILESECYLKVKYSKLRK